MLAEILDGKRHITCHSYVESEINMLMHVADSMGFKINTFTHILEGYKLTKKLKIMVLEHQLLLIGGHINLKSMMLFHIMHQF